MANPFVHVELMTGDVDKAKAFYGARSRSPLNTFHADRQSPVTERVLRPIATITDCHDQIPEFHKLLGSHLTQIRVKRHAILTHFRG